MVALRAAATAKAEEPYQQAVQRAQQNTVLNLAKSQRAAEAVDRLAEEAQAIARRAQMLQDKGEALPAQQAMLKAHQRMKQRDGSSPESFRSESDSSDDDDTPVKLSEFSPFALESALPDGPPSRILTRRLRWHRVYWWLLLLFFYSALKLIADPDRELSSAVRLEIIEELFPDWNKALERMNDGPRQPALKEFLRLLSKPRIQSEMFKCTQADWYSAFERWDVLYVWALLVVSLLLWALRVISELASFKLVTLVTDIAYTLVDLLLFTILNGISWYCVVKRLGCCGRAGYLVWAAVYVLLNLGRLQAISWSSCYFIYLLMIVPAGYMVVALIQLFRGAPRGLLSAAFFESSEARQELLHAYDVAAILTLYNDLCREEGSTSHSIKDSWECKLYDIKVTSPSGDVEWDPVMNRAPPDSDKDSVLLNGTRGLFESAAAKDTFLK
ncbi:unnamed protein product, partial [Effrenium voratum]